MPGPSFSGQAFQHGTDAFLQALADREAARMLTEDRARRDRLDQERLAEQNRQFGLQERYYSSIDEDRDERRAAAAEAARQRTEAAERERQAEAALAALYQQYDAEMDPAKKQMIGNQILRAGGKPDPVQQPRIVNEGDAILDPVTNKPLYKNPRTFAPDRDGGTTAPKVPPAVSEFIDQFSAGGASIEDARVGLSKEWRTLQAQGKTGNMTLAQALKYLHETYNYDSGTREYTPLGQPPGADPQMMQDFIQQYILGRRPGGPAATPSPTPTPVADPLGIRR